MREFEKWVARVLLLNSVLALGVVAGLLGEPQVGTARLGLLAAALLGLIAAVLSLRGHLPGLWGGIAYYVLQLASYFPYEGDWSFAVKAGVSIGLVLRLGGGILVINMVAAALLSCTVAVLVWRRRQARPVL
ncbi:hypothetical protein ACLB1G_25475 [Oxalobacteraceae bacterium A2-2]